jgi:hypothetical protein
MQRSANVSLIWSPPSLAMRNERSAVVAGEEDAASFTKPSPRSLLINSIPATSCAGPRGSRKDGDYSFVIRNGVELGFGPAFTHFTGSITCS